MYVQHKNVEKYFFEEVLLSEMSIYDEQKLFNLKFGFSLFHAIPFSYPRDKGVKFKFKVLPL